MNAEFNWWLLIVGLVIGAGLVWLVLADSRRRDVDILEREREGEALWIADTLAHAGRSVDADDVLEVLRLHADYLATGPPDEEVTDGELADEHRADGRWPAPTARTGRMGGGGAHRGLMAHPIVRPDDGDVGVG